MALPTCTNRSTALGLLLVFGSAIQQLAASTSKGGARRTGKATGGKRRGAVFVTIATDDYYAQGALVALHSIALHIRSSESAPMVDRVLMVSEPGISRGWRQRFLDLGVRVVDVPEVTPSRAIRSAMEADRKRLAKEGLLDVLQPVPYGGAFAKVNAWDPEIFGAYAKVVLVDGDVLIKRNIEGLLDMEPLAAGRDLMDAFNYGVVVLQPDAEIHSELVRLLEQASEADVARYNTRGPAQAGFCDQTIVTGFLASLHEPIHFFEDLQKASRNDPRAWVLSTEYNLVVSYRTQERCEDPDERQRVEKARIVHFANNWLNFRALVQNRESPGRIDSTRCYQGAFHYWHDVYWHAMAMADASRRSPDTPQRPPVYKAAGVETKEALPEEVLKVFNDFNQARKGGPQNSLHEL